MTHETQTGRNALGRDQARWIGPARLAIGLGWGLALWWLLRSADVGGDHARVWPASQPAVFGPLLLVFAYVPVLKLAGIGRLRWPTYVGWMVAASIVLALFGWHDVARKATDALRTPPYLSAPMLGFVAAALFIAHHLIAPADAERRWIARFPTYFDTAWKAGVQLALSIGFTGAFWMLLFLGAALFKVIGLKFLGDLITEDWFAWPVSGVVFALAVHLTDVRDGLIRGVRSVALMLLSWLLLVMTVLVAAFLIALPFTGLKGLWDTGSATALVLSAAGALIILINTAYQDGQPDNLPPVVLRIAVRVASVLLTPLIVIAFWGLALRIGQHGLTPDRIIAFACALVGVAYAVGYGLAALIPFVRRGSPWMKALELTNVTTAVLEVAVILALFTPLADPARLSVNDQVKRLESGRVTPNQFDYRFLRFESGRVGEAALAKLARSPDGRISQPARRAQAVENRYEMLGTKVDTRAPVITAWPAGTALPDGFAIEVPQDDARFRCKEANECLATVMDMNGDGVGDILLATEYSVDLFAIGPDRVWLKVGGYRPTDCPRAVKVDDPRDAMRAGQLRPSTPKWPDLSFAGDASRLVGDSPCLPDADEGDAHEIGPPVR
jgi:hypothetical protein